MSRSLLVSLVLIAVATLVAASSKKPEGNTCVTWGDPHIWTWDGIMWSTQGAGWYHVLISDKINIQGRFDYGCGGNDVTCIMGFRIFVVNNDNEVHTFEVKTDFLRDNDGPTSFRKPFRGYNFAYMTYIDGVDAHMVPAVNGGDADLVKAGINQLVGTNGGGKVAYFTDNDIYSLNFKFDDIVVQYLHWTLSVTPLTPGGKPNSLFKNVCGFCGTFNSNSDDDFFTRGQQRIAVNWENQDKFAATWKVTATDKQNGLFRCDGGSSTPAPSATPASPTPVPTSIVTRPPTAPPTETPTSTPTGTPAPSATPASTPTPTDEPTNPPTEKPTERPTTPPTNTPTPTPTEEPTPAPTPAVTTGTVTTGDSTTGGGNGNQTTNITVIVDQFNGTQAFTDANATCCADAFICPGDPLYESCMMDILKTNQTTLAVSASGALVLAGCAKTNITDSSCTQGSLFACPGACNGAGSCVAGKCNCRKGYKNDEKGTCVAAGLTDAQLIAVGVSAGIVAAIVIGAVVFLALAGFGAKKGYDYYHMKDNKMANVNSNPLYNEKKTGGVSPLYAEKA